MPKLLPIQLGKLLYKLTADITPKQIDPAITLFLTFVEKQQLLSKMPYILKEYEEYAKEAEGVQDIHITSAVSLSKEIITTITKKMNATQQVVVETHIDPELLGGVVIKQGNTIFDASIKAQLERMARTLN